MWFVRVHFRGLHRNLSHTRTHKGPDDVIPAPSAPPFVERHIKHIVKFDCFKMFLEDPATEAGHAIAWSRRSTRTRPFCCVMAKQQGRCWCPCSSGLRPLCPLLMLFDPHRRLSCSLLFALALLSGSTLCSNLSP